MEEGWKDNTGFLNDGLQRVFDSDYYQYFSYSLKSECEYETWKEPVSALNHIHSEYHLVNNEVEKSQCWMQHWELVSN